MKWLAAILVLAGALAIWRGIRMDKTASLTDGSIVTEIFLFLLGGALTLAGLVAVAWLAFQAL